MKICVCGNTMSKVFSFGDKKEKFYLCRKCRRETIHQKMYEYEVNGLYKRKEEENGHCRKGNRRIV